MKRDKNNKMAEIITKKERFRELHKELKRVLSKSRYEHVIGVEYTAAALAMRYGENMVHARLAGLMHDCARCLTDEELLEECRKYGIEVLETEKERPYLLHGKVGAYYCKKKYEIDQEGILSAIEWHTTGREAMSILEKIIFVADYIEPGRDKAPNLEEIRKLSYIDIDEAIYRIAEDTLLYLKQNGKEKTIDPRTEQTYAYYKKIKELKQEITNG